MDKLIPQRVLLFDFLRVVGISMILFSHVLITMGPSWIEIDQFTIGFKSSYYWTGWGEIGVTIFLIVSGLSLEFTYGGRKINFASYYLRRIVRIYPIYYMSLLLGLSIYIAFVWWGHFRYGKPFALLPDFGFEDFLLTLSGFNAFAGKWGGPLVWSSWFIGLLMVLYVLYPGISYGIQKFEWNTLIFLFLLSLGSRFLIEKTDILPGNPKEWFPLSRIFEFGLGIFLATVPGREFLLSLNRFLGSIPFLAFLGTLSFPLFLIHDPLRRFIVFGSPDVSSLAVGIFVFLLVSVFISYVVLVIDRKIQTSLKSRYQIVLSFGKLEKSGK